MKAEAAIIHWACAVLCHLRAIYRDELANWPAPRNDILCEMDMRSVARVAQAARKIEAERATREADPWWPTR